MTYVTPMLPGMLLVYFNYGLHVLYAGGGCISLMGPCELY